MSVEKYNCTTGGMESSTDGEYVAASDYAELQTEVARLKEELDALKANSRQAIARLVAERNELEARQARLDAGWFMDAIFELRAHDPNAGLVGAFNDEDIASGLADQVKEHFAVPTQPTMESSRRGVVPCARDGITAERDKSKPAAEKLCSHGDHVTSGEQCQHDLCEPAPTLQLIEAQCDETTIECTVCHQRWANPLKIVDESAKTEGGKP